MHCVGVGGRLIFPVESALFLSRTPLRSTLFSQPSGVAFPPPSTPLRWEELKREALLSPLLSSLYCIWYYFYLFFSPSSPLLFIICVSILQSNRMAIKSCCSFNWAVEVDKKVESFWLLAFLHKGESPLRKLSFVQWPLSVYVRRTSSRIDFTDWFVRARSWRIKLRETQFPIEKEEEKKIKSSEKGLFFRWNSFVIFVYVYTFALESHYNPPAATRERVRARQAERACFHYQGQEL